MSNFEKVGDGYSLDLTLDEAQILINLVEQLLELLGEGDFFHHYDSSDPLAQLLAMPSEIVTPDDPVLLRLLPNAYADPEAASDFRRYTEPQLRGAKQKNLRMASSMSVLPRLMPGKTRAAAKQVFAWSPRRLTPPTLGRMFQAF